MAELATLIVDAVASKWSGSGEGRKQYSKWTEFMLCGGRCVAASVIGIDWQLNTQQLLHGADVVDAAARHLQVHLAQVLPAILLLLSLFLARALNTTRTYRKKM